MTSKEAFETLKANLCGMCAYGSQNMESCDIRSCDNRDAIKALEQEHTPETVTEFADRCRECGKQKTGHWIDGHCSECGCDAPAYIIDYKWQKDMNAKYCPNCGALMQEVKDGRD